MDRNKKYRLVIATCISLSLLIACGIIILFFTLTGMDAVSGRLPTGEKQTKTVWYALGDSITAGWTSRADPTEEKGYKQYLNWDQSQRWVNIVAEKKGYALKNYGIGGTGYLKGKRFAMNARQLADTLDFAQCDFVTLAYGVNDWKYAVNIGGVQDIPQTVLAGYDGHSMLELEENAPERFVLYQNGKELEEGTDYTVDGRRISLSVTVRKRDVFDLYNAEESMVSNMSYVIKKILRDNPLCKIFVISPINCKSVGSYPTNWGINYAGEATNGLGLEDIFQMQRAVCDYYGIELIDMTHSSIVNRENIRTLLPDNVHPTVEGHKALAMELADKIHFD